MALRDRVYPDIFRPATQPEHAAPAKVPG
jgi:hypothetical protein